MGCREPKCGKDEEEKREEEMELGRKRRRREGSNDKQGRDVVRFVTEKS